MSVTIAPPMFLQFQNPNNSGSPAIGLQLFTYQAGTSIKQSTWTDSTQGTPNANPMTLDGNGVAANGASGGVWGDPTLAYKLVWAPANDTDPPSSPIRTVDNVYFPLNLATLTQTVLGLILYPRTAAEIAAGVTPVNLWYPYGYVDRYGNNTTPGTTDMASVFSKAAKVANQLGCTVRWGATAPYALNTAVDCTGLHGVVFTDESSGAASSSAFCSIVAGNNGGHTFDLATSYECTFRNLTVRTAGGKVPLTLFFCARNSVGSGAGIHRFENVRVTSNATFSWIYYGYGSEENNFIGNEWYNAQPGSGIVSVNATNPSSYSSTFVTVATGSQSNADHRFFGNSFIQLGNSGSQNEVCIQIQNTLNFSFRDGLFGCASGLCYVLITGTTASNNLTFDRVRGELVGNPVVGWQVSAQAASITHAGWTFNNCTSNSSGGALLNFSSTNAPSIQNLLMTTCTCISGTILEPYNMSASHIESLQDSIVLGQAGGNVSGNVFVGGRNNIQLSGVTISTPNIYLDNNLGVVGTDNDSFISSSTACTGALTTAVSYKVILSPNGKQVTLRLPAIQGTTTAAASFTLGVAIPAAYRPNGNLRQLCAIVDNGATLNQAGQVFVTSSTGVIVVFKDIVGTGNWTNGTTGGLASETDVTWTL